MDSKETCRSVVLQMIARVLEPLWSRGLGHVPATAQGQLISPAHAIELKKQSTQFAEVASNKLGPVFISQYTLVTVYGRATMNCGRCSLLLALSPLRKGKRERDL